MIILNLEFILSLIPLLILNLTHNTASRNRVSKKLSAFISSLWVAPTKYLHINQIHNKTFSKITPKHILIHNMFYFLFLSF